MGAPQIVGPAFFPQAGSFPTQFLGIQTGQRWYESVANINYVFQQLIGSGGANINGSGVFSSPDGTTYAELDLANRPSNATGAVFRDTANNQWICALVTNTSPQTQQNIFLKNFSFTTNTWGANYAGGGPLAQTTIVDCFLRPDGTIFVIFDLGAGHAPVGQTRLQAAFWNGAAWSANIDVGAASLPAQNIIGSQCTCAMDPATGDIHIAYNNGVNFFYQQILANNTLGDSHAFGALGLKNGAFGNLLLFNGRVYITGVDGTSTNNEIFVGTPFGATVWTTIAPVNLQGPAGKVAQQGMIQAVDSTLYWEVSFFDPTFVYVGFKIFTSTDNGLTWTIAPGNDTEPFFYDFTPGQSPVAPGTDATFGAAPAMFFAVKTSLFGVTTLMYAGVRNSVFGDTTTYVVNAQIFQTSPNVVVSPGPGQPKSLRIVHLPKICCPRKRCYNIATSKEFYVIN